MDQAKLLIAVTAALVSAGYVSAGSTIGACPWIENQAVKPALQTEPARLYNPDPWVTNESARKRPNPWVVNDSKPRVGQAVPATKPQVRK